MRKPVSPLFAVIVIIFALVAGYIWFQLRLRNYDAAVAREAAMLQARADRQMRSGRRGEMTSRRGSRRGRSGARGGAEPGRGTVPGRGRTGAAAQPGRAPQPAPAAKPGASEKSATAAVKPGK